MPYTTLGFANRYTTKFAESINMEDEVLRLLRENNTMLRQIMAYIATKE